MIRLLSAFLVVSALLIANKAFINKACFDFFFYLTLSCVHGAFYDNVGDFVHSQPAIPLTELKPMVRAERDKRTTTLPEAKLQLMLMLDPDISDYIDTNYANIEFCRLFAEVQEIFDTITDRKVTIEFSALHFEVRKENMTDEEKNNVAYLVNNTIGEIGTLDVLGTISDIADVVQDWNQTYDAYLFLTRRPLVAKNGAKTIEYKSGYSMIGGACRSRNNIAIAKYSFKDITHQITHLLGAVHYGEELSSTSSCGEGNYTNQVFGDDALVRIEKGFSNCTRELMIDFLRTGDAFCLYSDNVTDSLDCDSIIPEIG